MYKEVGGCFVVDGFVGGTGGCVFLVLRDAGGGMPTG